MRVYFCKIKKLIIFAIVIIKNYFCHMKNDLRQLLKSSILNPSAQSIALSQVGVIQLDKVAKLVAGLMERADLSRVDKAVISTLFEFGLRISEVLSIAAPDIKFNGMIFIRGLKNSEDRFVKPFYSAEFWQNVRKFNIDWSNGLSRFYYYRLFKKIGLYERFPSQQKLSVTHFFRHYNLYNCANNINELDSLRRYIGHKNINSTLNYAK